MQIVGEVDRDQHPGGGGVDAHVVRSVVEKLGARVSLNIVAVVISPPQLDVEPEFLRRGAVHCVPEISKRKR